MKFKIKPITLLIVMLFLFTGCQQKDREMITAESYKTVMEKLTYKVESKEKLSENLEAHLTASTKNHRIDYYVFKTEESAEKFFANNANVEDKDEETEPKSELYKKGNLSIYQYEDDKYYIFLSKISRSVIHTVEHPVLKESITPVVEYIGYGKEKGR